jgi:hypothetical protein
MQTADQSELLRMRNSAQECVLTTDTCFGVVNISALKGMLSSSGTLQRNLCVGTYEKNAYQCNSGRRVAGGHGRWPKTIRS